MDKFFIKEVCNNLHLEGFEIIPSDVSLTIDDNIESLTFFKQDNGNIYFISIINNKNYNINTLDNIKKHIDELLKMYRLYFNSVIVLRVFLNNKYLENIEKVMEVKSPFIDQYIYYVFWQLSVEEDKIKIKSRKGQPTKILNIKGILEKSYLKSRKPNENTNYTVADSWVSGLRNKNNRLRIINKSPALTTSTILILISIYGFTVYADEGDFLETLIKYGAVSNDLVRNQGEYGRIITSTLLHANIEHLLSNILALAIFGSRVEKYMGKMHYFFIFMIGGALASVSTIIFQQGVSVGASGGIFALIGALVSISLICRQKIGEIDYQTFIIIIILNIAVGEMVPAINNLAHMVGLGFGIAVGIIYSLYRKKLKFRSM